MKVSAFLPPWGEGALPPLFDQVGEIVDASSLDGLWVGDHIVFPFSGESEYPYEHPDKGRRMTPFDPDAPHFEPISLLGYLAGRTRAVRLGVSVLVLPMRNPVETAKSLANIAALNRGRLVVGIGVGWNRQEFEALGARFEHRGRRTDDLMRALRHLWSTPNLPFSSASVEIPPVGVAPRPDPQIRLVVGGNSKPARDRAVRLGDGWHALRIPPRQLAGAAAGLDAALAASGRSRKGFSILTRDWVVDPAVVAAAEPRRLTAAQVQQAHRRVADFRDAGVDELIVEFPGIDLSRLPAWLEWCAGQHADWCARPQPN